MTTGHLQWGILSTARIARRAVAPAIHASSNGELRAVASRDPAQARAFATDLEIPVAHNSYTDLLADDSIDAVYIPLPTSMHHEWVIAAAQAGKHVLVDKPFAVNASEASEMVQACRSTGVQLIEGFMYRYDPRHARMQELVADGAIGALRRVVMAFSFPIDRTEPNVRLSEPLAGGALGDLGTYCISASRLHMGGEPTRLFAQLETDPAFEVDMDGNAILDFGANQTAIADFSFNTAGRQHIELVGDAGSINARRAIVPTSTSSAIVIERPGTTVTERFEPFDSYQAEVENMADAIRGEDEPLVGGEEAIKNMRVLDLVRASAASGRWETLR